MIWQNGSGDNGAVIFADWGNEVTITGNFSMDDGVYRDIQVLNFVSDEAGLSLFFGDNTFNAATDIWFVGLGRAMAGAGVVPW